MDEKCKDITRLCFYSFDESLFLNKYSDLFQVKEIQNSVFEKEKNDKISEGGRNNHLTEVCGRMNRNGLSYEAIKSALITENTQICSPPLSESEIISICKSISKYDSDDPILPKFDQEQSTGFSQSKSSNGVLPSRPVGKTFLFLAAPFTMAPKTAANGPRVSTADTSAVLEA